MHYKNMYHCLYDTAVTLSHGLYVLGLRISHSQTHTSETNSESRSRGNPAEKSSAADPEPRGWVRGEISREESNRAAGSTPGGALPSTPTFSH